MCHIVFVAEGAAGALPFSLALEHYGMIHCILSSSVILIPYALCGD